MKSLMLFICIIFCLNINAQKLIQDETYYATSGSSFKIITSNEQIKDSINKNLSQHAHRITASQKKDRKGYYWEYVFYFKPIHYNTVIVYIKKL